MGYPTQCMEWEKGVEEEGRGEIKMEGRWREERKAKWRGDQEILAPLLSTSLSSPSDYPLFFFSCPLLISQLLSSSSLLLPYSSLPSPLL